MAELRVGLRVRYGGRTGVIERIAGPVVRRVGDTFVNDRPYVVVATDGDGGPPGPLTIAEADWEGIEALNDDCPSDHQVR